VKTRQFGRWILACRPFATAAMPRDEAGRAGAMPRDEAGRAVGVFGVITLAVFLLALAASPAPAAGTWRVFLYGNEVRALAARGEDVWAGTTGGLVRLSSDGTLSQWNRAAQELLSDSLSTVAIDAADRVWAGTETAGISIFEPHRTLWTPFTVSRQPIPGDKIMRVRFAGPASAETVLVGAARGYAVFVNGDLLKVCLEGIDGCRLPSHEVRDLVRVGMELWIATAGNATAAGMVAQDFDGTLRPRDEGLGRAHPRRLARADSLYLATYPSTGGTLWVWRNGRWGQAGGGSLPSWFVPVDLLAAGDPQKSVVVGYTRAYGDKYKADVSTCGGHAYDGLMLAVQAIKTAGSTDKAKVRDALEATRGYIGTGGVVNMSATDHMGLDLSAFRMLVVKNGNWVLAE
jgi:hypothetical protein